MSLQTVMANKVGRNDPCPCGSGQKYKKCCQSKDEAAARASAARAPARPIAAPSRTPTVSTSGTPRPSLEQVIEQLKQAEASRPPAPARPRRELTPDEQWWETWWGQMKSSPDLDSKLALARQALVEAPDLDDDSLLQSFDPVWIGLERAGRHAERVALIDQLEQRFPLGFGHSRGSFAHLRFESAIELPGADWSAELRRLGVHASGISELISDLPSRLAWEGRSEGLRALMETAWPAIRDDKELLGWAAEAWAGEGAGAILRHHLERDPELKADDPALLADLAPYERSAQNRPSDDDESTEDFEEEGEEREDDEPKGLGPFVALWLRLLQAREDLPADRAVLTTLGQAGDREAMAQVMNLTAVVAARLQTRAGWTRDQAWVLLRELGPLLRDVARRQREAKPKVDLAGLLLPPTSVLLDRLERRNVGMFASELHKIAAVCLALPAWAGLMAERGWVSETQAHAWQQEGMGETEARWRQVPEPQRDALAQRVLDFTAAEGRSRDAWLR